MQHGQYGSEVLATFMRRVFEPLVQRVYEQGGFITHFAGDAFMAVFTPSLLPSPIRGGAGGGVAAAWAMQQAVAALGVQRTPYGDFSLAIKLGLDFGRCSGASSGRRMVAGRATTSRGLPSKARRRPSTSPAAAT